MKTEIMKAVKAQNQGTLVSVAASQIRGAFSIETILQTAPQKLERMLGRAEVLIRFQSKGEV